MLGASGQNVPGCGSAHLCKTVLYRLAHVQIHLCRVGVDVRARVLTSPLFLLSHEIWRHPAEADHDLPELRTSSVQAHEVSNTSAPRANPASTSRTLLAQTVSRSNQKLSSSLRVIFSRLLFN